MKVSPLSSSASDITFGVQVFDFNVETDFEELQKLVYDKLVVVIRAQFNFTPESQYKLTKLFDPDSESYGHGHDISLMSKSVLQQDLNSIPRQPQVKLLGHGFVKSHEGLENMNLKHPQHHSFHKFAVSPEDELNGYTRFYRWHMDAALYQYNPPRVTSLYCISVPQGRRQTIRYDDGTNDEIKDVCLGTTAFVSGERAYEILTPEQKEYAHKTLVRYAPHPYIWIKNARALSNGLSLYSDDLELPINELPPVDPLHIKTYPMVWKNRITGKYSLQIHGCCVHDLIVDGIPMNDLKQAREKVYELMRPGIDPTRVYTHEWKPGDLTLFSNRSVWHTVVGTMNADDVRVFHQCNLAGSEEPLAADPLC